MWLVGGNKVVNCVRQGQKVSCSVWSMENNPCLGVGWIHPSQRIRGSVLPITSLINTWASAPSKPTLPWIMWQVERPLTLQLSGAQAFLKPLHFILQEADMPHHVLWWVYLHGNVSRGGRSWYGLVQLLLKDSSLENKKTPHCYYNLSTEIIGMMTSFWK